MLSKKTKYGLKALSFIAKNGNSSPIQIATISTEENIPHKFLENILLTLKKTNILTSKKGKGGGYLLADKAENIKLSEVIRALEGPIAMLPCVSLNYYEKCDDCPSEEKCGVHRLLIEVRDSTLAVFENKTVSNLI